MKLDTIIFTHAGLADGFAQAARMIMGPLPQLSAVGFYEGDDMLAASDELTARIQNSRADAVVILSDLFGATPTNAALLAISRCENAAVLTGVNLIMVLQAAELDGEPTDLDTALKTISEAGGGGIRILTKDMVL